MTCSKHPAYSLDYCQSCVYNLSQDPRDEAIGHLTETVQNLENELAYTSSQQARIRTQLEEQKEESRSASYLQWLHGSGVGQQYDAWRSLNEKQIATIQKIDSHWRSQRTALIEEEMAKVREQKPDGPINLGYLAGPGAALAGFGFVGGIILIIVLWIVDQFLKYNEHAFFIRVPGWWWSIHWILIAAAAVIGLICWGLAALLEDHLDAKSMAFENEFERMVSARGEHRAAELPQEWHINGPEAWAWNELVYAPNRYPHITNIPKALNSVGPYPPMNQIVWEHQDEAWRSFLTNVGISALTDSHSGTGK